MKQQKLGLNVKKKKKAEKKTEKKAVEPAKRAKKKGSETAESMAARHRAGTDYQQTAG